MRKITKAQFLDDMSCGRKVGCIVDVDMGTGQGKLISKEKLMEETDLGIEIVVYESAWFSTYEMIYQEELEKRRVKVVMGG